MTCVVILFILPPLSSARSFAVEISSCKRMRVANLRPHQAVSLFINVRGRDVLTIVCRVFEGVIALLLLHGDLDVRGQEVVRNHRNQVIYKRSLEIA